MKQNIESVYLSNITDWKVVRLYPHCIGYNLVLDVHVVLELSIREILKEDQVITIETGI